MCLLFQVMLFGKVVIRNTCLIEGYGGRVGCGCLLLEGNCALKNL